MNLEKLNACISLWMNDCLVTQTNLDLEFPSSNKIGGFFFFLDRGRGSFFSLKRIKMKNICLASCLLNLKFWYHILHTLILSYIRLGTTNGNMAFREWPPLKCFYRGLEEWWNSLSKWLVSVVVWTFYGFWGQSHMFGTVAGFGLIKIDKLAFCVSGRPVSGFLLSSILKIWKLINKKWKPPQAGKKEKERG